MRSFLSRIIVLLFCPTFLLAQNTKSINIFTLGDSNGSFPYSWPRQLQLMLPDANVFNISKSGRTIGFVNLGDTSLNSLLALPENLRKAAEHAQEQSYDFIVLELGTNDAKAIFADRQSEVPVNLEKLIKGIRNCSYNSLNKARIIVVAPPPYGKKTDTTKKYAGGNLRVQAMSQSFQTVAARLKCEFINGYSLIGDQIENLTNDGIHLNAGASQLLMEPVAAIIRNQIPKKPTTHSKLGMIPLKLTAPFPMPDIKLPDFRKTARINIVQLGAMQGDKEKNSLAISSAIDKAHRAGGGTVVIPAGEWLTGKIHLKSNVNLHLEKNAVLLFSEKPEDYLPAVHSSWEGMECYNYSPLIYAYECNNIAITGEGELKAKMEVWEKWFPRPAPHMESIKRLYNWAWNYTPLKERDMVNDTSHLRPQFLQFNRCSNVLLEGVSIKNSPFWTIHLYLSKDIAIRNVHVYAHGHNNDGIDPEMSQNVLIENCEFDQGDDAIAIKSGRNPEGWRLKTPSKNIVIRNCLVKNGHQLVAIGSELSGGIENVLVENCVVQQGAKLNHLLFIKTNERMGGYVRNIYARNLKAGNIDQGILGVETDVLYQWRNLVPTYEKRLTPIQDVYLDSIDAGDLKFIARVLGQETLPVKNIRLHAVNGTVSGEKKFILQNVEGFEVLDVNSQVPKSVSLASTDWHDKQRELRYRPEGSDFVITNGNRLFTRALYGTNTAFRVETGDRPEFALYMPGMGGNFKLGLQSGDSSIWLTQAKNITARYRAGSMLYTIEDPLLGAGKLHLQILALAESEGFVLKTMSENVNHPVSIYWAFGGASGKKFSRDGDMGPDPESSFYLKPENCKDNRYTIDQHSFILSYGSGLELGQDGRYFVEDLKQPSKVSKEQTLTGIFPTGSVAAIGDATKLHSPLELLHAAKDKAPVISGHWNAVNKQDYYLLLFNPEKSRTYTYADAPAVFEQAEKKRQEIANRVKIHTPDPYINTLGGTLAIASDATWESPTYLHGSIGWRMRLNGWRGAYTADALGWHDRARTHLEAYAQSQLLSPDYGPVIADTATNLARSWEKLGIGMFTSGYISRDPGGKTPKAHHYDMNLVFIDILLRHYDWTGDKIFLKKTWPVIKRHLAWEKRNFDADGDGLYDAYAAIWASDALQYSGGGVTHSSAYNYFANRKAAQIAALLKEDPTLFRLEAEKILKALYSQLWMNDKGSFAEFKDALGNRMLHPSAALWTIYHSMDSRTMNPFQAWQSLRYVDNEIPHIPIKAKGLEEGGYHTLSTTSWMPYEWSLNNVALAEVMHTALAYWQGGRWEEGFHLFKSQLLAEMYLGGSPGNVGQISYYDAIRGEAYRDFGDPVGILSRALVEGLFGITPDALNNRLLLKPGLPASWNFASFSTPDISFDFKRTGRKDHYTIVPRLPQSLNLELQLIAQGQVKNIRVNGQLHPWKNWDAAVGAPIIILNVPAAESYSIDILWEGASPAKPIAEKTVCSGEKIQETITGASVIKIEDPQQVMLLPKISANGYSATLKPMIGKHTVFAQVKQGALIWWMPISLNVQKPFTLLSDNAQEKNTNKFRIQNYTPKNETVTVRLGSFQETVSVPAGSLSEELILPETSMVTGTNRVKMILKDGRSFSDGIIDWKANTKGRLETIDLSAYFNDKVTQIFQNKYLTPRPQVTTLQLPVQGIGDWPHFAATHLINDEGIRKMAGENNRIVLPEGIPFFTPGEGQLKNIVFTSQWDNYPKEVTIGLSGKAAHAWFLMAGSTNPMQSQLNNGMVLVQYTDGSTDSLLLRNPETWWPIDQDYYTDGFAFSLKQPRPNRVHLLTGKVVNGEMSKESYNGKKIPGGAATILDLPLDASKTLQSLTLKTIANDVVIGLMSVTLLRE